MFSGVLIAKQQKVPPVPHDVAYRNVEQFFGAHLLHIIRVLWSSGQKLRYTCRSVELGCLLELEVGNVQRSSKLEVK